MVTLRVIVEGGVYPNTVDATTGNNVQSLRQSLNSFLSRMHNSNDISIKLFMGMGYRNAAKLFIDSESDIVLFVDSDLPSKSIDKWFEKLENKQNPEKTIIIPDERKQYVFFMIQEMEAWFLKQPECMDTWANAEGYTRIDKDMAIASHSLIRNKNIEEIAKHSEKLKLLLKRFFKKGKKSATYGKLKTSPGLLDALNADDLVSKDSQLQKFLDLAKKL